MYPALPVSFGGANKYVGQFYLVSMPGWYNILLRSGKCVMCRELHNFIVNKDNSEINHSCVSPIIGCL